MPVRDLVGTEALASFTPSELLDRIRSHVTQPEMPREGAFSRVMSLHKAKGITARAVVISGCVEGLIPTLEENLPPTEMQVALQEQRRLLYVALTRCRQVLVISSVVAIERRLAYRMGARVRGRGAYCGTVASRFLSELGPSAPQAIRGDEWDRSGYF